MSVTKTLLRAGDRMPILRRASARTRVNVLAVLLVAPVVAALYLGTYVSELVTAAWILSAIPAALYVGLFGEHVRNYDLADGDHVVAFGVSPGLGETPGDDYPGEPIGLVLAGAYGALTVVALAVRFVVLG